MSTLFICLMEMEVLQESQEGSDCLLNRYTTDDDNFLSFRQIL